MGREEEEDEGDVETPTHEIQEEKKEEKVPSPTVIPSVHFSVTSAPYLCLPSFSFSFLFFSLLSLSLAASCWIDEYSRSTTVGRIDWPFSFLPFVCVSVPGWPREEEKKKAPTVGSGGGDVPLTLLTGKQRNNEAGECLLIACSAQRS